MKKMRYLFKKGKNETCCGNCGCGKGSGACGGGIYFLGFIGAAVYYIQQSTTFWQGVLGLLKAVIWPVFLVYKILGGI